MSFSLGNAVSLAIGILLIAKVGFILWGSGNFYITLAWFYIVLGLLGLLGASGFGLSRGGTWLTVGLVLGMLVFAGVDFALDDAELYSPYGIVTPFTVLLVAVFVWRHRTWLRWPKRGSWRWVVAVVLIGKFSTAVATLPVMIHLFPYLNPVTYRQSLPQANLQQQFLAAGVQADLLTAGVRAPVLEELTRLGTHLLGVHPLANAALFAIAHRSTDPLTVRDGMIEAAGRQMLRDPRLGHKSLDLANDERVVKQWAFTRLLSLFLSGLLYYWLLIRSQSIWPPLAAHVITNVIRVLA